MVLTTKIILVEGAKFDKENPIDRTFGKIYSNLFGIEYDDSQFPSRFKRHFTREKNIKVDVLKWAHRVGYKHVKKGAEKLFHTISQTSDQEIILIGKSLGGTLIQMMLNKYNLSKTKLHKAIYLGAPLFPKQRINQIKEYNIFSSDDKYILIAARLLWYTKSPRTNTKRFNQNLINIECSGLKHSDFNYNKTCIYKGEEIPLFHLIKRLIQTERDNQPTE